MYLVFVARVGVAFPSNDARTRVLVLSLVPLRIQKSYYYGIGHGGR